MTKQERRVPRILAGSRRKRIADGAGVQIRRQSIDQAVFPNAKNDEENEGWKDEKTPRSSAGAKVYPTCPIWILSNSQNLPKTLNKVSAFHCCSFCLQNKEIIDQGIL